MTPTELTETSRPDVGRGGVCVLVVATNGADARACVQSLYAHTATEIPIVIVGEHPVSGSSEPLEDHPSARAVCLAPIEPVSEGVCALTSAVDRALSLLWPADVAVLSEPCVVGEGWLEHLREAARADTNTASASALADANTALALSDAEHPAPLIEGTPAGSVHPLRPRLSAIVGPCVYLRRDALELVGTLDRALELRWALEIDLAQRCLLAGLAHIAADDVVVHVAGASDARAQPPLALYERYPYLPTRSDAEGSNVDAKSTDVAASSVLPRALEAARGPRERLSVTIDARSLGAVMTGTQRHIFELAKALAATGALRLRALVSPDTAPVAIAALGALPHTDVLPVTELDADTPRSTIFHRPQQVFQTDDLRLAMRLGERFVLNQLDLIAYRNPAYHADGAAWERHRRINRQALAAADRVVVFSDHTRLELISDELTDHERLRVVPPGLDHPFLGEARQPAALADEPDGAGAGKSRTPGYLLCLGTDFRHKNRIFALRVLKRLREQHGWDGRLVLAGARIPHGSSHELERAYLDRHPQLQASVIELDAIGEEEKAWLVGHAATVIYPSVYEGFGLVPLEAGLSGVPCVFAPQSSLAEVLPPGAATIVPWDVEESASRTYSLLSDHVLRSEHVEMLRETARALTWSGAADAMVDIYHEAAVAPMREAIALSRDEFRREEELRDLIAAHDALVVRLVDEREHARHAYDEAWHAYTELQEEVGFGLSLIGPHGALPEDVQRALLALSARPALRRPVFAAAAETFRSARAVGRYVRRSSRTDR